MELEYKFWKVNSKYYKVYVDRKSAANKVMKKTGAKNAAATYLIKGKEVGWDFFVPTTLVKELREEIKQLKNKK